MKIRVKKKAKKKQKKKVNMNDDSFISLGNQLTISSSEPPPFCSSHPHLNIFFLFLLLTRRIILSSRKLRYNHHHLENSINLKKYLPHCVHYENNIKLSTLSPASHILCWIMCIMGFSWWESNNNTTGRNTIRYIYIYIHMTIYLVRSLTIILRSVICGNVFC